MKNRFYYLLYILLLMVAASACRVMPKPYSLNDDVKQDVEGKVQDSVIVKPGEIYKAGPVKRFLLGDHYRDTWLTPIKVPVLNLDKEKGGLEITERGGGQQTYSLKVKAENGKLYSIRSIQKDPSPTLPMPLQYSFADDIVQDQISASHPFGAFILPPLGDAAGIFHTNPKMVFIPDTPELGKYREEFGGVLAMIEEDADEDWSDYEDFGFTKNAVSTETVMDDLQDDNENRVDQESLLRVRLFDIWIGDWDRHDGQFRWAEFEDDRGKYFQPIPEDRDNVFFKFDGFFPWWARRKWALRKFQSFDGEIRDIAGLNHNARYLDRRFLTALSREQWVAMAKDLQNRLTDEVIEEAVGQMPAGVFENNGRFLITSLKERRDKLVDFANRYYEVLAKTVDIVGSDNNEWVDIQYDKETTTITMYDASEEQEKKEKIYERTFYPAETKEIRIYTRGDEDFIYASGNADKAPRVRVIGGLGEDIYADSSQVRGWKNNNYFYDNEEGTTVKKKQETKTFFSESLDINRYDFESFKYNYLGPAAFVGFNVDDGVYIGGGVIIKTHGFRKEPYASYHKIAANVAPRSGAWNFDYESDFKNIVGEMGLNLRGKIRAPNYFTNFFGFGNETTGSTSTTDVFNRARYSDISFQPSLTFKLGEQGEFKLGPQYRYTKVNYEQDKFITTPEAMVDDDVFKDNHFLNLNMEADIRTIKNTIYPERGIRWKTDLSWQAQLNNDNRKTGIVKSEFSAYYTIEEPTKITFASRIGAASISGDYLFFQANTIGGNAGLGRQGQVRGYRRDRFSGRTSMYQNNEVRVRLARIPFYYLPLAIGVSMHYDYGRVWVENEDSSKWHRGVGGGIWFNPLGKWVFTTTYTHSEEDGLFLLNLGWMF